jgi:glycosyltransferase involved in cell wall biosynthesis
MATDIIYCAAHAEFADTEPLGGGKAVADYLVRSWRTEPPGNLHVVSPRSAGLNLPKPLVAMSELEYARFCRQFERAATDAILQHDPSNCAVLINDISEGPDFALLGERGYRMATIFHVDVVEFFTKFYLRGWVRPETAARQRWFRFMPNVLRLVFEKQYQCIRHSRRLIVPSEPMRDTILRCYPGETRDKVVVTPWGNLAEAHTPDPVALSDLGIADDEVVIITLSRLSHEKGIERLLAALSHVTAAGTPWRVLICGAAAYMGGRKYERRLKELAAGLNHDVRVEFPGHLTGARKAAVLHRADVFVSPSHHESYGLTIAEAEAAGCRVVSHQHYGASGTVVDCADPVALGQVLTGLIRQGRTPKQAAPSATADPHRTAREMAKILASM